MIYTVAEAAKRANLSKASIYTRLKTNAFKTHIIKKQGMSYIDEAGLKQILDDINTLENEKNGNAANTETATDQDTLKVYKEDIIYLKEVIANKDIQLAKLDERLKAEQDLTRNSQILLNDEKIKNKLLDEPKQEVKEGFFKRFFNT